MDGNKLAARLAHGAARGAAVIGRNHALFRPADPLDPLDAPIGVLPAAFRPKGSRFGTPNSPQDPWFDGVMDLALVRPGDYLAGPAGTYFIWQMVPLGGALCVRCNDVLSLKRPAQVAAAGPDAYGGNTASGETLLMAGWPAAMLRGARGGGGRVDLPGNDSLGAWAVLLPPWPGVTLRSADVILRAGGGRAVVTSAERTDGWRLLATEATS
ncbi:conserved protein of unknown function [Rhodovastum atsumiense]|uniref:Uncharacterized protein n=1 Tax=Rhodovastum atsumiense TaxID=504468 RepID=A0A5M6J1E8_9PROT|nr:hypothetical protein [Rhodovastum atsumiense]KAA5613468.1 hypothetical protein F1189_05270 [Rhodovastum atsumiense]CAH2603205.1 conserved protein of unknown function [Rhodovastum atsumiense]